MTQSEIRRECLTVAEWEPATLTLAEEAKEVLNYSVLQSAQQNESGK